MTALRSLFQYPLLGRELTERAARRRTYIARVIFGAVLYGLFSVIVQRGISRHAPADQAAGAFGFGYELLQSLVHLLSWSLLLVQPAIMATSITREKEREAFGLLLLTRLSPGKILVEKYFAGLFPTATLLLLALPLAAVTMGYGGVSFQLLIAGGMVLFSTWLMVGAWALFCSAWCRTSLGALLLAYLGGAAILFAAPLAFSVLRRDVLFGSDLVGVEVPQWIWGLWPQEVFAHLLAYQRETFSSVAGAGNFRAFAWEAAQRCTTLFAAAAIFLCAARVVMLPRAASKPAQLRALARFVARYLPHHWFRKRAPRTDLPGYAPIEWREHGRSILGGQQHFVYVAFLVWGGTLALSIFLLGLYPPTRGPERLHRLGAFTGGLAIFVLVSTSVSSLLNERANRTLDILCTTPLGIGQLLRQKAHAVGRYSLLFGVMLAIIFGTQAYSDYEYFRSGSTWRTFGQQWATSVLALVVYPPLVIWTSLFFAAYWGKRARAIFGVLALFAIWAVLPLMILEHVDPLWRDSQRGLWYSLLSPLGILDANEHDRLAWFARSREDHGGYFTVYGSPWVPVVANNAFYTLLALSVRWMCLRSADRLLRR